MLIWFDLQVPIGGNYRLIDIPMSNCINSGFNKIFIMTQFNSFSLNRHLARSYNLGNGVNFGDGFVEVRWLWWNKYSDMCIIDNFISLMVNWNALLELKLFYWELGFFMKCILLSESQTAKSCHGNLNDFHEGFWWIHICPISRFWLLLKLLEKQERSGSKGQQMLWGNLYGSLRWVEFLVCDDIIWVTGLSGFIMWFTQDAKNKNVENVLILSGDHLYRMDYTEFLQVCIWNLIDWVSHPLALFTCS